MKQAAISLAFGSMLGCASGPGVRGGPTYQCPPMGPTQSVFTLPDPIPPQNGDDGDGPAVDGARPCRSDAFVVDWTSEENVGAFDIASAKVLARMNRLLGTAAVAARWTQGAACSLAMRTVGAPQHRLLVLQCGARRGRVTAKSLCGFMSTLEKLYVGEMGPVGVAPLNLARECDATPHFDADWHRQTTVGSAATTDQAEDVRVALVDVSVEPKRSLFDPPLAPRQLCYESGARGHIVDNWSHGTAVTRLAHRYATKAQLLFYRGIRSDLGGPASDVALALERVRDTNDDGKRLVVNLSLGWPPAHGEAAAGPLTGTGESTVTNAIAASAPGGADPTFGPNECTFTEGAIGLSVKTQLIELEQRPDTIVLAAAGNRRKRTPDEVYYPAKWDGLVVGVDWYQPDSLKSNVDRLPRHQVRLAAPGAFVQAPGAGIHGTSGTSLATAIASGVAAGLLQQHRGESPASLRGELISGAGTPWRSGQRRLYVPPAPLPTGSPARTQRPAPTSPHVAARVNAAPSPWPPAPSPLPDWSAAGSVGPQPPPGCGNPDCFGWDEDPAQGYVTVFLENGTGFKTNLQTATVHLHHPDGKTYSASLASPATNEKYPLQIPKYAAGTLTATLDSTHKSSLWGWYYYTVFATQPIPVDSAP